MFSANGQQNYGSEQQFETAFKGTFSNGLSLAQCQPDITTYTVTGTAAQINLKLSVSETTSPGTDTFPLPGGATLKFVRAERHVGRLISSTSTSRTRKAPAPSGRCAPYRIGPPPAEGFHRALRLTGHGARRPALGIPAWRLVTSAPSRYTASRYRHATACSHRAPRFGRQPCKTMVPFSPASLAMVEPTDPNQGSQDPSQQPPQQPGRRVIEQPYGPPIIIEEPSVAPPPLAQTMRANSQPQAAPPPFTPLNQPVQSPPPQAPQPGYGAPYQASPQQQPFQQNYQTQVPPQSYPPTPAQGYPPYQTAPVAPGSFRPGAYSGGLVPT